MSQKRNEIHLNTNNIIIIFLLPIIIIVVVAIIIYLFIIKFIKEMSVNSCTYVYIRRGRSQTILEHTDHNDGQWRSVYTRTDHQQLHRLDWTSRSDRTHSLYEQSVYTVSQ